MSMSTSTASHAQQSGLGRLVTELLGDDLPIRIELHDGTSLGPPDAPATVRVRTSDALRRIVTSPGELGFARAYVVGDIEIVGDIYAVLSLRSRIPSPRLSARQWVDAVRLVRVADLIPMAPPSEEIRISRFGRLHSRARDAVAISHHYDVSNEFYELVLGPAMVYSCALWEDRAVGLEAAQWAKVELICQKLALRPGIRLLDIGCGWGTLVRHAARHHGVDAVGITLSRAQAEWARDRTAAEGLSDRVEIRVQDYRDIRDGPFDAVSSVGMFEHVGAARLAEYFDDVHALMTPRGRFLNHAISRPPGHAAAISPRSFVARYVFPDGELHEVGSVVTAMQAAGFEARHVEDLREHYALTLRSWVSNLEANWDQAIAAVGIRRARIWRLYMAGSALGFEEGRIGVHQVLGLRDPTEAHFPLRPDWVVSPRPAQAPAPAAAVDADRASELALGDPHQVGR